MTERGYDHLITALEAREKYKQQAVLARHYPIVWNGMEYVIQAKGPMLGPVRSFNANRRRQKRNKIEREENIHQN